jgi:hypothetical protein
MTRDRARKQSVRARMAASGESYSVAARKLTDDAEPRDLTDDAEPRDAVALLRDRADATLAAHSARIQFRMETNFGTRKDLPARLFRFAVDSVLQRIAPGMDISIGGVLAEGFVEPVAGRYQIYWGGRATVLTDGRQFFGRPGAPIPLNGEPDDDDDEDDWLLDPLEDLRGAACARFSGEDTVRGTPCQVITAETGSHEYTVWVDDAYIRRASETTTGTSRLGGTGRTELTRELWDFGVATGALDWLRFPGPQQ